MNTQIRNQIRIDEEASARFAILMAGFMARTGGKAA